MQFTGNSSRGPTRFACRLAEPEASVLDLLNRLGQQYPDAISLASGRPSDEFCTPEIAHDALREYEAYAQRISRVPVNRLLGQYGPTSGIINEILLKHLATDEGIDNISCDDLIVTVGFQEGAAICVAALFDDDDVLLVPDPVFVGITGIAKIFGCRIWPIPCDDNLDLNELSNAIEAIRAAGLNPRAMYVIPDFSNPQGACMNIEDRARLIAIAADNDMLILEDGAYSTFRYEGEKVPSLMALDVTDSVIYLGTFSKTVFPGIRVGYLIAKQRVLNEPASVSLATVMCRAKSFLSVNTSPLNQGIIGGILLQNNYSLLALNKPKIERYRVNRDVMLRALQREFSDGDISQSSVTWNAPSGGFFVTVTLPFPFLFPDLLAAAGRYGVIVFPVSMFSSTGRCSGCVRLAFTNVGADQVELAVGRFAEFAREGMLRALETKRIA